MVEINKLAAVGVVVTALTASLLTSSAITRKVAVGAQESYTDASGSNVSCVVGELGEFKSNYSPDCNGSPGAAFTSGTTNFWPVIPAQNSFGNASPEGMPATFKALGLSGAPFTTCDPYMNISYGEVSKTLNYAFGAADASLNALSNGCVSMIPEDFSQVLNLTATTCGALGAACTGLNTFQCVAVLNKIGLPGDLGQQIAALNGLINGVCLAAGATTRTACAGGWWFWTSIFTGFKITNPSMSVSDFVALTIGQCDDGNKNQDSIDFAQNCVIAGMVFTWVAFVAGIGSLIMNIRFAHFAPAVFNLLAAVLFLVGLFRVYNAPVYANVGVACPDNQVCYNSGVSMNLALAGIACGAASAIIFFLSVFLCSPVSQKEEKVEYEEPNV